MRVALVALFTLIVCSACGGDDSQPSEPDACAGQTGCNGACELGNSFGVGRTCTQDGGECAGQAALFCTVDFEENAEQRFCTRPCDPDADILEQCGEDAVCRGEEVGGGGPAGCVPNFCL